MEQERDVQADKGSARDGADGAAESAGLADRWGAPEPRAMRAIAAADNGPLGVGILYTPSLRSLLQRNPDAFDHVGVVPEAFWPDVDPADPDRAGGDETGLALLDAIAALRPVVAHGLRLSIGGKGALDRAHLARIADWHARFRFRWYSEHLAVVDGTPSAPDTDGVSPLPYDRAALRRVADRVREIQALLPIPFLLENNVYPAGVPQQEMSEPAFLNRLCAATGCGLLIDVHNLCLNAQRCGIDALAFLDRIDFSRVVEIHVGAGQTREPAAGFAPRALRPPSVHELLEAAMWRASKLRAVTIEVHDGSVVGRDDDLLRFTESVRRIWKLYR
jgi:uncharacterized protein (UPF0276 family)